MRGPHDMGDNLSSTGYLQSSSQPRQCACSYDCSCYARVPPCRRATSGDGGTDGHARYVSGFVSPRAREHRHRGRAGERAHDVTATSPQPSHGGGWDSDVTSSYSRHSTASPFRMEYSAASHVGATHHRAWLQTPVCQDTAFDGKIIPTKAAGPALSLLKIEILSLLERGAIEKVNVEQNPRGFYSKYFLVPKRGGGV